MALAHDNQKMSLEAFFQWIENHPGIRYEYLDGTITMMTGGTARHALIGSNLNRILGNLLEGGPCLVYSSDAYVQVTETACVCPDLTISCDPRDRDDLADEGELKIIQYPRIVVEVLSPGTEAKDRGIKAEHYQSCSTMQEFLLVDTQTPKIQLYRRTPGNLWTVQLFRLHEEIELKSLGVTFPVVRVYANTRLAKQK
jgi:Uma2 family endonuclease